MPLIPSGEAMPTKIKKKETLVRFLESISKAHLKKPTFRRKNSSREANTYKE